MNKTTAQEYAAELLEAAADGQWADLLATGLNAETIEAVRELNQLNLQIERSEERERVMHQALIGRLQMLDFDEDPTTDGGDRPTGANTSHAMGSTHSIPQKTTSRSAGVNPSGARGFAQSVPPKPAGFDLMDLGVPQRRNVA